MYQTVFLLKTFQGKCVWSQVTVFAVSHHPLQHTHITSTCSYTSCIDCIRHYNGTRAGPDLVDSMSVVVVYCCCILLQLALKLHDHCTLFVLVVISFHQLVQILHLHTWWLAPAATCICGGFPSTSWRKYSTCTGNCTDTIFIHMRWSYCSFHHVVVVAVLS